MDSVCLRGSGNIKFIEYNYYTCPLRIHILDCARGSDFVIGVDKITSSEHTIAKTMCSNDEASKFAPNLLNNACFHAILGSRVLLPQCKQ